MTSRERVKAVLNYENYDRMPVVSFGYWNETFEKWYNEGHITKDEWQNYNAAIPSKNGVMKKLGFELDWDYAYYPQTDLFPKFEIKVLEEMPNGQVKKQTESGVIAIEKQGIVSISAEVGHTLVDRQSWEEFYLPKLQYSDDRIDFTTLEQIKADSSRDIPIGLYCGSLMGRIRDFMGVEGLSYIYCDDEELFREMIDTLADLVYKIAERVLGTGIIFDYGHFWEDICFKNGPLVIPSVFGELVGHHYKRITKLLNSHGINIISLDCDGVIDSLIPTWIENGVNTMFPIEVGTWCASIEPWRAKYGKELRGVGGMNKTVFSRDYKAIDEEIERLKPLIDLGGYIPCPDHRIAPDAIWENVQYYCDKIRNLKV